jgi:hypothetical protein
MKYDKIYLSLVLLVILTIFSWVTSCTHVANIANLPVVCFTGDVLPIFKNNCAIPGCHDGSGRESHMALNNYADISRSVISGNPNSSSLYQVMVSKWGNLMPPGKPLSLENRTLIRLWIEQGATLTTCGDTTVATGSSNNGVLQVRFSRDILPNHN